MLRASASRLGFNKSAGYRWSPIPNPPPAHTDRLYGTHSVLNALRVFARRSPAATRGPPPVSDEHSLTTRTGAAASDKEATAARALALRITGGSPSEVDAAPTPRTAGLLHHPHRRSVTCLYVRDFNVEGAGEGRASPPASVRSGEKRRVIPPQYSALHRVTALAKDAGVPVRFVPRSELWKLCGERRNQGVVLEVASYTPSMVADAAGVLRDFFLAPAAPGVVAGEGEAAALASADPADEQLVVLYLDNIIDPTNIGSILRSGFFFGVDRVILSPHCAACTPAVARTSTGFLEYMDVARSTVPTAVFLRNTRDAFDAMMVEAGASTRDTGTKTSATAAAPAGGSEAGTRQRVCTLEIVGTTAHTPEGVTRGSSLPSPDGPLAPGERALLPARRCRLLVLGNEDAGLAAEVQHVCTHLMHIGSPRQRRLARDEPTPSQPDGVADSHESGAVQPRAAGAPRESELERRERVAARLRRLRPREVSLNVNTACAVLLSRLTDTSGEGARLVSQPHAQDLTYVVPTPAERVGVVGEG